MTEINFGPAVASLAGRHRFGITRVAVGARLDPDFLRGNAHLNQLRRDAIGPGQRYTEVGQIVLDLIELLGTLAGMANDDDLGAVLPLRRRDFGEHPAVAIVQLS